MQIDSEEDLRRALELPSEAEGIDFKRAENQFSLERLCEYIAAMAFEGGGSVVLGVTDKRPRKCAGTNAFPDLSKLRNEVFNKINWRIETKEFVIDGRRVLVVATNASPRGRPIVVDGRYYHRTGEALRVMGPEELRSAFVGAALDFSGRAKIDDLSASSVARFRDEWARRDQALSPTEWSVEQLLENAELTIDGQITNAALLLLGSEQALRRYLPHAEVVFEFRAREADDSYGERREFSGGLLLWIDEIWERINSRNTTQQFAVGLFRHEVVAFDELTIREAMLNAFAHRDYENAGSCWVKMWPSRIEVHSPGGFPKGITADNIIDRQFPRNRRLAEAMKRCGLVERSGQGADRMFRNCIEAGKPLPDYSRSDADLVLLDLRSDVTDPTFARFLENLSREAGTSFSTADLRVLDMVRRRAPIPESLNAHRDALRSVGAIERRRGRAVWALSVRYLEFVGPTSQRDHRPLGEASSVLVAIQRAGAAGIARRELVDLTGRSSSQVGRLLDELKNQGRIERRGAGAASRWFVSSSV